jgi:predicted helicase
MLFDAQQAYDAQPDVVANMSQELLRQLAEHYGKDIAPRDVFNYIYAVMFAPSYRTTHAEQLKVDFPRVPMCKDSRLFDVLAKCGEELVNLHLLTSEHFRRTRQRFCGKGDSRMVEVCYDEREEKVYINPGQYFEHVAPEVWNYHVGGYQVCEKWLKDRKGRVLALDDILHYIRIAHALARTIEIQRAIDAVYDNIEKDVIEA